MSRATLSSHFPSTIAAVALLGLAGIAAYWNSLGVPFLFDDVPTVGEIPVFQSLAETLSPSSHLTTAGRPVLNLTFALNQAMSGQSVWSYHATNILIHVLSGLCLFAIVRRTLQQPGLVSRFGQEASALALLIAGLWLLHPLQTESVTYIVQRAESLAGLFYLLTLYLFLRGSDSNRSGAWHAMAVFVCLLGMATKEVMVSAPLLVFLYDRTFISGDFKTGWQRRQGFYLALAATWLPLAWLVAGTHGRGGSAGFFTGVSAWQYALTQSQAVVHYLCLIFWPYPLVLDYGTDVIKQFGEVWWQTALLLVLLGITIRAIVRQPPLGFLAVWFFAILAPSSSFVPIVTQTIAEHRIYLSLAAPVTLLVLASWQWLGRRTLLGGTAVALVLGGLTVLRNADYQSGLSIWSDTVKHRPDNARAQLNLGVELLHAGQWQEAKTHLLHANELKPDDALTHYNLGLAWQTGGNSAEALMEYKTAVALAPANPDMQVNLGNALVLSGNAEEALPHYRTALQIKPAGDVHFDLGLALDALKRADEAAGEFEAAVKLEPNHLTWRSELALRYARRAQWKEAAVHFKILAGSESADSDVHANYGNVLLMLGQPADAVKEYETSLRLRPGDVRTLENLQIARQSLR